MKSRKDVFERLPVLSVELSRELEKLKVFPKGSNNFLWRKALTDWNMKDISADTEYILFKGRGKHRVPESGRTRIATKIETHLLHSNTLVIKRNDASEGVKFIYFRHPKSGANMLINLNFVQFYHYILSSVK